MGELALAEALASAQPMPGPAQLSLKAAGAGIVDACIVAPRRRPYGEVRVQ